MSITTILPKRETCSNEDRICVLFLLKQQANFPVDLSSVSETLKIPLWRVERVISDLEGHVTGDGGEKCAYVHKARCANMAVYIS